MDEIVDARLEVVRVRGEHRLEAGELDDVGGLALDREIGVLAEERDADHTTAGDVDRLEGIDLANALEAERAEHAAEGRIAE